MVAVAAWTRRVSGIGRRMDLGAPASYLTLTDGTPVFSADGQRIGVVIDTRPGNRFADAPEVDRIHERGVVLTLDAREAADLPEPSRNPATMRADPDDVTPDDLGDKLRRAWDLVSGRY